MCLIIQKNYLIHRRDFVNSITVWVGGKGVDGECLRFDVNSYQ